jgi:hypothetical protein
MMCSSVQHRECDAGHNSNPGQADRYWSEVSYARRNERRAEEHDTYQLEIYELHSLVGVKGKPVPRVQLRIKGHFRHEEL